MCNFIMSIVPFLLVCFPEARYEVASGQVIPKTGFTGKQGKFLCEVLPALQQRSYDARMLTDC